jgi:hypothetical protein
MELNIRINIVTTQRSMQQVARPTKARDKYLVGAVSANQYTKDPSVKCNPS